MLCSSKQAWRMGILIVATYTPGVNWKTFDIRASINLDKYSRRPSCCVLTDRVNRCDYYTASLYSGMTVTFLIWDMASSPQYKKVSCCVSVTFNPICMWCRNYIYLGQWKQPWTSILQWKWHSNYNFLVVSDLRAYQKSKISSSSVHFLLTFLLFKR